MNHSKDEPGYAKIEGKTVHQIITQQNVILGREKSNAENSMIHEEQMISLGVNQKISRRHLFIYFDHDKSEWYAKNLSKNPVFINKALFLRTEPPRCISPISAIQIDEMKFYFFQSKEDKDKDKDNEKDNDTDKDNNNSYLK